MRYSVILFCVAIFSFSVRSNAQTVIPNASFEQWSLDTIVTLVDPTPTFDTFTVFRPHGWGGGMFGSDTNDTTHSLYRSTDAHSGLYALGGKETLIDSLGVEARSFLRYRFDSLEFPIVGRPRAFEGWFKFHSIGNDYLHIVVYFINQNYNGILGFLLDSSSHESYTHFSIPLPPKDSGSGDIDISIGNMQGVTHLGTEFVIDDLDFTDYAFVAQPNNVTFGIEQNYPNPFREGTTIGYVLSADCDNVRLEVLNLLGERVALLKDGPDLKGEHQFLFSREGLTPGTYVCRLISPQGISSRFIQLIH